MDINQRLKEEFVEIIESKFEKEDGITFLRVYTSLRDFDKVTELSRYINQFLDKNYDTDKTYFLDVLSKGTEEEISINDLSNYIDENILVKLKEFVKNKIDFEGSLLEIKRESLIIKWNAKGQFRKQELLFENIKSINLSTQVKKRVKNGIK